MKSAPNITLSRGQKRGRGQAAASERATSAAVSKGLAGCVQTTPTPSRKSPASTDDFDERSILRRIENGETLAAIAHTLGVDRSTLSRWLKADEQRSARAREARAAAAAAFDEQAEQELRASTNAFELSRARELAQHLRWRASKINPKAYGDRLDLSTDARQPTVAEALRALNNMEVPPHAPMPPGAT